MTGAGDISTRALVVGAMLCFAGVAPHALAAQRPTTRSEAIRTALASASPRMATLVADTLVAAGRARSARAYPNPTAGASYSRSAPQNHVTIEVPLDLPYIRGPRVRAAAAARNSARYTFLADRAATELDVDTLYTYARGAMLLASLSSATAADASELLQATRARRDAGDASDLEVNIAQVSAEQARNAASTDSLAAVSATLILQSAMGLRGDTVTVVAVDSLTLPPPLPRVDRTGDTAAASVSLLRVEAARAAVAAASENLALQRANVFGAPAIQIGVEGGDPAGDERGVLPIFGIALPLPLFSRNQGELAASRAEVGRARALLEIARMEAEATLAAGFRMYTAASARLVRDTAVMDAAQRNVALSTQAYREGEMAITDVLEARRAQRDVHTQYVNDIVAANVGAAVIRVLTTTESTR